MKPIQTDWQIQLPNQFQIDEMWEKLDITIVDQNFEFIDLLKTNIGGELYFKGFKISENEIFDWFCSRGRLTEIDFENKFLLSDKVLESFVTNKIDKPSIIGNGPKLQLKNEFIIDGELAALLFHGGAYGSKFKKSPKEIKNKAQDFCNQLFNENYCSDYVMFYTSNEAWNTWFNNFIIDLTFILICMKTRTIWIIAFTDMD